MTESSKQYVLYDQHIGNRHHPTTNNPGPHFSLKQPTRGQRNY